MYFFILIEIIINKYYKTRIKTSVSVDYKGIVKGEGVVDPQIVF